MGKLFGTDGIRGVAGADLTPGLAAQVGRAAAVVLEERLGRRPAFVIGRDTRLSGTMLEAALVAGITSGGGDVEVLGVMPTPAVAALVIERGADAGVVVSASHNPYADNGIKFFNAEGFKLSDDEEAEIEDHVTGHDLPSRTHADIGRVSHAHREAVSEYVDELVRRIPVDASGLRIAVDCANGAMFEAAALGLRQTGAELSVLSDHPDGVNINDGCGSTHMAALQQARARRRRRPRPGLRRRRRPRAGRRPPRRPGRRRLRHGHPRPPPAGPEPPAPRHDRHHGDDQPRLPPRHAARGDLGAHHRRRRPLRAGRHAGRRLRARRRAVGARDRPRRVDDRRRPGDGVAAAAGAARRRHAARTRRRRS